MRLRLTCKYRGGEHLSRGDRRAPERTPCYLASMCSWGATQDSRRRSSRYSSAGSRSAPAIGPGDHRLGTDYARDPESTFLDLLVGERRYPHCISHHRKWEDKEGSSGGSEQPIACKEDAIGVYGPFFYFSAALMDPTTRLARAFEPEKSNCSYLLFLTHRSY